MSVLPEKKEELIQFVESHVKVWENAPTAIGLTAAQVSQLSGLANTARASYVTALEARDAAKSATQTSNTDVTAMRTRAADLIRQIKAYAELQASPNSVLSLAQIPAPAPPSPAPAPGRPEDFGVTLDTNGAVQLSWSCENAAATEGTFFTVSRRLPGEATFRQIGGTAGITRENRRASFTDGAVPSSAAADGASYIVQGFKGTRTGPASDIVTVIFGIGTGGGFSTAAIRKAA